jgi:hypothetical protein
MLGNQPLVKIRAWVSYHAQWWYVHIASYRVALIEVRKASFL